ncbi:MAG TPA: EAL domain-containing response regulator [Gemmatimonadaceae bacterium]|jgi:EAL domain-containing protein (putative c-di-GMP-specific phosphodiesterase class I)/ActR/RegA family two-component response regulator
MKIFVIDDEPFALRLVSRQLQTLGFSEVTTHEHAMAAVRALEADVHAAELILLDLQMPEMDGIEFVRHLARLKYSGGLILVSGEDDRILQTASTLAKAHALDVRGAMNKPVAPDRLRALVEAPAPAPKAPPRAPRKTYGPQEIARAIDGGELVNHYQPKVELATGKVVGVETLVRWQHPQDGLVYPDQFIGVAEEHRLIDALTRVVLLAALRQARAWLDEGSAIVVAVNVSMDNLAALDFPDFVEGALRDAGVSNRQLVLEVTETRLMTNVVMALDILTRLRLKHIGLSIDDFGTGHSSLAQLRNIPFDELKIDRGFVHGADRDASARAIVEASLGMARQLGLTTVAEGVEVFTDWQQMRAAGCDIAQGYFIARPMPAETFNTWHAGWTQHLGALIPQ